MDAREFIDRLAELDAPRRVFEAEFHRVLRHTDGAGCGLDAGAFERRHQLLEALAFLAAQKLFGRDLHGVEAKLVFLHAPVTEHFDLAAGHAVLGERIVFGPARLFDQQVVVDRLQPAPRLRMRLDVADDAHL